MATAAVGVTVMCVCVYLQLNHFFSFVRDTGAICSGPAPVHTREASMSARTLEADMLH
jgi:hypothetical protein